MTRPFLTQAALAVSGLTATGIGAAILLAPGGFYALSGVTLPDDTSLLNDLRAFGGGLVGAGVFIGLGLVRRSLTRPALIAAAILYGGFGLARLWAIGVDGMPGATYLWVLAVELAIAAACAGLAAGASPGGPGQAARRVGDPLIRPQP